MKLLFVLIPALLFAQPNAQKIGPRTTDGTYFPVDTAKLGWYDVRWYGAAGDDATDDTAAIQGAVDAAIAAGGGIVWIPPGRYVHSVVNVSGPHIEFRGAGGASVLVAASANTTMIAVGSSGSGFACRDLWLYGGATTNAGTAITVAPAGVVGMKFEHLDFENFTRSFYMDRVAQTTIKDVTLAGNNTALGWFGSTVDGAFGYTRTLHVNGIHQRRGTDYADTTVPFLYLQRVVNSTFSGLDMIAVQGSGLETGIVLANDCQDVRISDTILIGWGYSVILTKTTVGSTNTAPSFNNFNQVVIDAFDLEGVRSDQATWTTFTGGFIGFSPVSPGNRRGFYVIGSGNSYGDNINITGTTFHNQYVTEPDSALLWLAGGVTHLNVSGCTFTGFAGTMIVLSEDTPETQTDYIHITGNQFTVIDSAVALVNAATGLNIITRDVPGTDDVSLNPLDTATTYIRIRTDATPASSSSGCPKGAIAWDTNYVYVCVATDTWKRSALGTW